MDSLRALQLAIKSFCVDRLERTGVKTDPTPMFNMDVVNKQIGKSIAIKLGLTDSYQIKDELFFSYSDSTAEDFASNVDVKNTFRDGVVTLWVTVGNGEPFDTGFRFYWFDKDLLRSWESVAISRSPTRWFRAL